MVTVPLLCLYLSPACPFITIHEQPRTVVSSMNLYIALELCSATRSWVQRKRSRGLSMHLEVPVNISIQCQTKGLWCKRIGVNANRWHETNSKILIWAPFFLRGYKLKGTSCNRLDLTRHGLYLVLGPPSLPPQSNLNFALGWLLNCLWSLAQLPPWSFDTVK